MVEKLSNPYNQIAEQWNAARREGCFEPKYIDLLIKHLTVRSEVLDVGCGVGTPIARYLIDRGYSVTGIDASEAMLEIAKQQVSEAHFIEGRVREPDRTNLLWPLDTERFPRRW